MYAVFAVQPHCSQAICNELRGFGDLLQLFRIYGDWQDYDFEIWELEFDSCDPILISRVLRGLMSWGIHVPWLVELLETDCDELSAAVNLPIPIRPSLTWCVRRFLAYYPAEWRTYWTAVGHCGVTSADFLSFMRYHGAVSLEQVRRGYARVVTQFLSDRRYATPDFLTEVHEVVGVGNLRIDFTRRQYDESAPVPTVWVCRSPAENVFPPHKPSA